MNYSVFDDCTWLFPDTPLTGAKEARLDVARGGHAGFQVLADSFSNLQECRATLAWTLPCGLQTELYELLPVTVNENTSPTLMTTTDHACCKDYVTRQAPFQVYDGLLPCCGPLPAGRPALYVRVHAPRTAEPGIYHGLLRIVRKEDTAEVPVSCNVHRAAVPSLHTARLGMLNFFCYENISAQHHVKEHSDAWWALLRPYIRAQLRMRCTHIILPPGQPVFRNGQLVAFDFSFAERIGQIAIEEGAPWLCGGHIAHWNEWTENEYFPFWDPAAGVTTPEGYLQLRLYFIQWAQIIHKNNWKGRMAQALADEPQVGNASTYRILAGICRKFLPGVPIIDAVETTDLGGGIDIWVPKQETYEKWRERFDLYKAAGEVMWFYTCAFPAGNAMNRSMDLPLTVSRAVLWMTALYRLSGYLHWGFNYYLGPDIWHSACCPHKGALLPAGDAHIVYPGEDGPLYSMRFEAQRGGAEDCELLFQLADTYPEKTDAIIRQVCRGYRDYTADGGALTQARRELLELLDHLLAAADGISRKP